VAQLLRAALDGLLEDALVVRGPVVPGCQLRAQQLANSLEHLVGVNLGRVANVGVVEQVLDTEHNLMSALDSINKLTCLMVICGFHDFSSSRIERQMVPEG